MRCKKPGAVVVSTQSGLGIVVSSVSSLGIPCCDPGAVIQNKHIVGKANDASGYVYSFSISGLPALSHMLILIVGSPNLASGLGGLSVVIAGEMASHCAVGC